MRLRSLISTAGAALLIASGLTVATSTAALAAPNFQMPFACGFTATAATFSGHSPANSVDFQKDGITGTSVRASAAGTVTRSEDEPTGTSYGRWIEVDHGGGWRTRYAHLSSRGVSVGATVKQGQELGKAGGTGNVSGPHLHFEENLNGVTQKAVLNGVSVPYYGHTSFTSKNSCGGGGGSNPYTPGEFCGSGYSEIDRHDLGSSGSIVLMYNSGNGKNCVTTLKYVSLGTASAVGSTLQVEGGSVKKDSGNFAYYAGPGTASAAGKCVKWGGSVGSTTWTSGNSHCG
jgi:hypothetical protein